MANPLQDIKEAGVLAALVRFGVPWHGTVIGGTLSTGLVDELSAEITRTWPQPDSSDCWLIQKPGLPDPYAGEGGPERKAEDALRGHEYTEWALLTGGGNIHGDAYSRGETYRHRWIWFDSEGEAYAVEFGLAGHGAAVEGTYGPYKDADGLDAEDWPFADDLKARFRFTRFGHLMVDGFTDNPADQIIVDVTLTTEELGQDTPTLAGVKIYDGSGVEQFAEAGNMVLRDLTPTGDQAIFEIHSLVFDTARSRALMGTFIDGTPFVSHREFSNPLGFVMFTLSGTGLAPSIGFDLIADRATVLGSYSHTRPTETITSNMVCDCSGDPVVCLGICEYSSTTRLVKQQTGRIVGYYFDDDLLPQSISISQTDDETVISDVVEGSHTGSNSRTRTAGMTIGASSLGFTRTNTGSFTADQTSTDYVSEQTDDSGVAGGNITDSGTYEQFRSYLSKDVVTEGQCGISCISLSPFTPSTDNRNNFLLPTATDGAVQTNYQAPLRTGAMRFGGRTFSLLNWEYVFGSVGIISPTINTKSYVNWVATGRTRFYGAWNPATESLEFPIASRVNFA